MIKIPTYDYECNACGAKMEFFHAMSAKPKLKCPKCGKRKLIKLIGAGAGIIFKGDGFYRTCDYINKKAKEDGMTHSKRQKRTDTSL